MVIFWGTAYRTMASRLYMHRPTSIFTQQGGLNFRWFEHGYNTVRMAIFAYIMRGLSIRGFNRTPRTPPAYGPVMASGTSPAWPDLVSGPLFPHFSVPKPHLQPHPLEVVWDSRLDKARRRLYLAYVRLHLRAGTTTYSSFMTYPPPPPPLMHRRRLLKSSLLHQVLHGRFLALQLRHTPSPLL